MTYEACKYLKNICNLELVVGLKMLPWEQSQTKIVPKLCAYVISSMFTGTIERV